MCKALWEALDCGMNKPARNDILLPIKLSSSQLSLSIYNNLLKKISPERQYCLCYLSLSFLFCKLKIIFICLPCRDGCQRDNVRNVSLLLLWTILETQCGPLKDWEVIVYKKNVDHTQCLPRSHLTHEPSGQRQTLTHRSSCFCSCDPAALV